MPRVADGVIPLADLALARRLENAEGHASTRFVETRARLEPGSGAAWIKVAGAYALYDGVKSPITQTFGLGMFQPPTAADLDSIERFFQQRGAPVYHEVSPLADPATLTLLNERGYRPLEFTNIMFRPTQSALPLARANPAIKVRLIGPDEHELWTQTAVKGWSEFPEYADSIQELMRIAARRDEALDFLAELAGEAIATGSMSISGGVALLAGASTIPGARKQGAQRALLESRLRHAAEHGCDIATMGAQPGSASQRNAERQGFRIAYTRIKWVLGSVRP
jgi:hypothetical protein